MVDSKIIPLFEKHYFGQRRILEHLSILVRWSQLQKEALPPLLLTGARGQGLRVLGGLLADHLSIPIYDLRVFGSDQSVCCKSSLDGRPVRFDSFLEFLKRLPGDGLLFFEPEPTVSTCELDDILEQWRDRGPSDNHGRTQLSNLLYRAEKLSDVPMFVTVKMAAHFHFGPNDDEGEYRLQQQNAERKGYSIDQEALRAIVSLAGGSDALGERLLDLVCKRRALSGKEKASTKDVSDTWDLYRDHLVGTVEPPE